MNDLVSVSARLLCEEDGVSAIEYALIASIIAIAVTVTVLLLGQQVHSFFLRLKACMLAPSTC